MNGRPRLKHLVAPSPELDTLKPEGFEHYMTVSEVARLIGTTRRWFLKMEVLDRIPIATRVRRGTRHDRLYSPSQVEEIRQIAERRKR